MPPPNEGLFFFEGSGKRRLLGFLHRPPKVKRRSTGVVFCHAFADEKSASHRILVTAGKFFSECGFPVLRFDMSGCGDSEGELDEVTLKDWQQDLYSAVEVLKNEVGVEQYILCGLRLGGGLSLLHAKEHRDATLLILWQPVIDFKKHISEFIRKKISTRIASGENGRLSLAGVLKELSDVGRTSVIGYPITERLYQSFCDSDLMISDFTPPCPTLLTTISLMEQSSMVLKNRFGAGLDNGDKIRLIQIRAEPFWDRPWRFDCQEVLAATRDWLLEWIEDGK